MGQNALLPFKRDHYWSGGPDSLLGSEYTVDEKDYVLVKNDEGTAIDGRRALVYKDQDLYEVELGDAVGEKCCGVTPKELAEQSIQVPQGALFLMQTKGRAEILLGDGVATAVAGEWAEISADADGGKIQGRAASATSAIPQPILGTPLTSVSATDGIVTVELFADNLRAAR